MGAGETINVRSASEDDLAGLAQMWARALQDDPFFAWVMPDDAERARKGPKAYEVMLRSLMSTGSIYSTDDLSACASGASRDADVARPADEAGAGPHPCLWHAQPAQDDEGVLGERHGVPCRPAVLLLGDRRRGSVAALPNGPTCWGMWRDPRPLV